MWLACDFKFYECPMNITWMYCEYDLNVTWMCPECNLNVNVPRICLKLYSRPIPSGNAAVYFRAQKLFKCCNFWAKKLQKCYNFPGTEMQLCCNLFSGPRNCGYALEHNIPHLPIRSLSLLPLQTVYWTNFINCHLLAYRCSATTSKEKKII